MNELTNEEYQRLWAVACHHALRIGASKSDFGHEDLAATAIKRLLTYDEEIINREAWVCRVITNMFIDQARKKARLPEVLKGLSQEELETFAIGETVPSLGTNIANQMFLAELLENLPTKEQELLILYGAGFSTAEIAEEMGYKSARVVATRLQQVQQSLRNLYFDEGLKNMYR